MNANCVVFGFMYSFIPQTDTVKYLDLHFDKRLTWREHVIKTRKHLDLKPRELIWLIGKHSPLSLTNKLLIYKTVLTLRLLMSYIYGAPILDVSRSHTTTQHSR